MRSLRWLFIILGLVGAVSLYACSDSEDAVCGNSDDCPADQICSDGFCTSPSGAVCMGDPDCPGGYQCVANECERIAAQPDAGNNVDPNADPNGDPNNQMTDMGMPNNTSNDNVNPTVVAFSPAAGTTDVPLDTVITIEFDEPLRETSVNFLSLPLKDGSNNDVATTVTWDEATLTATITPNEPLRPATPYTIQATSNVFDQADNPLIEESARFYTVFEEPEHHTAVASTYAPVIFQSIRDASPALANGDIPTTVDFDANKEAADNLDNAKRTSSNVRARVYYSVVETESHYYIQYTLYYAWRFSSEEFPHDFSGIVVLVEKSSGEVQLVEGAALRRDELSIGFGIDGRGVDNVSGKVDAYDTMPAADLIDGTRFPLFVTPGTHEACSWTIDGSLSPVSVCLHSPETFTGETGVVIRPGAAAQKFSEAADTDNDNVLDMTYELVPLVATLWTRRSDVGIDRYWESNSLYRPDGMRPAGPEGAETALLLPTNLTAPRDDNGMPVESFGRPPFQWFQEPNSRNAGQWLIDPAFLLTVRYTFGADFSQSYCFNPYLAIDRLDAADAPDCATPQ